MRFSLPFFTFLTFLLTSALPAFPATYRAFLETNDNAVGGIEVFGLTYDTFDDLLADNQGGGSFSQLNINGNYSLGGVAYDGKYRFILETNDNAVGGVEVFLLTYDTYADFLSDNQAAGSFSQLNINGNYSVAGFAFDGAYRLLLETNDNAVGGIEVFGLTYNTFADLLADNQAAGSFSQLNINGNYSLRGFAYEFDPQGPPVDPSVVPLPASLALFAGALLALGLKRRRCEA